LPGTTNVVTGMPSGSSVARATLIWGWSSRSLL
jgi:hypothetical protein